MWFLFFYLDEIFKLPIFALDLERALIRILIVVQYSACL
jgi:hypothetical protein